MITIEKVREVFVEKLAATDCFNLAFKKAVWTAFLAGYEQGSNERLQTQPKWDEIRMDVIGQNGNDGDHYDKETK